MEGMTEALRMEVRPFELRGPDRAAISSLSFRQPGEHGGLRAERRLPRTDGALRRRDAGRGEAR